MSTKRSPYIWIGLALGLALVAWLLRAWLAAPAPATATDPALSAAPAPAARPADVEGRVVTSTGAPLAGARVRLIPKASATDPIETTAGADGSFAMDGVPPGHWELDASAEGHVRAGAAEAGRMAVMMLEDVPLRGVTLVLQQAARLEGRVVAAGKPVPGANISLYYVFSEGIDGQRLEPFVLDEGLSSDAQGRFAFPAIAPGRLRVFVEAEPWAMAESLEVYLRPGDARTDLTIDLAPSLALTGEVRTPEGQPILAEIEVLPAHSSRPLTARASADGQFRIDGLGAGPLSLTARAPGFRPHTISLDLQEGTPPQDLVLQPARGVFGRVVGEAGEPVHPSFAVFTRRGAPPEVAPQMVPTAPGGTFEWDYGEEDPAQWTVSAISPTHAPAPEQNLRPGEEMVLTLVQGGLIRARVVDMNMRPVARFQVAVESIEIEQALPYGNRAIAPRQLAEPDGRFGFGPLRPGLYQLRVEAPGFAPLVTDPIAVRARAETREVLLQLQTGAAVTGRVTVAAGPGQPGGQAVQGAQISVMEPGSALPPVTAYTDAQGFYRIEGVRTGRRTLRVHHPQYLSEMSAGIEVPQRGEVRRDVQLAPRRPGERFSFAGIGAVLGRSPEGVQVQNIMEDSSAALSGLESGDIVVAVDGQAVGDWPLDRVVDAIRGEEGSSVRVNIRREGQGEMTLELLRKRVVVRTP